MWGLYRDALGYIGICGVPKNEVLARLEICEVPISGSRLPLGGILPTLIPKNHLYKPGAHFVAHPFYM